MTGTHSFSRFAAVALAALLLVACEVEVPSQISTSRLELVEATQEQSFDAASFGAAEAATIAEHHRRYGAGSVALSVTYDPARKGAALAAQRDADRIARLLQGKGISTVSADALPVAYAGSARLLLLQYDTLIAQPPSDCETPILETTNFTTDGAKTKDGYRLGCSVETMITKQVARPADLGGKTGLGGYDGARAAGQLEDYRKGKEFDALKGETATEQ